MIEFSDLNPFDFYRIFPWDFILRICKDWRSLFLEIHWLSSLHIHSHSKGHYLSICWNHKFCGSFMLKVNNNVSSANARLLIYLETITQTMTSLIYMQSITERVDSRMYNSRRRLDKMSEIFYPKTQYNVWTVWNTRQMIPCYFIHIYYYTASTKGYGFILIRTYR